MCRSLFISSVFVPFDRPLKNPKMFLNIVLYNEHKHVYSVKNTSHQQIAQINTNYIFNEEL